jgi:hypothetical protein
MKAVARALSAVIVVTVRMYQITLARFLPPVCRFEPSCSRYMLEAVTRRGPIAGAVLGIIRILRCNPWFLGGYDPVPERGFRRCHEGERATGVGGNGG